MSSQDPKEAYREQSEEILREASGRQSERNIYTFAASRTNERITTGKSKKVYGGASHQVNVPTIGVITDTLLPATTSHHTRSSAELSQGMENNHLRQSKYNQFSTMTN